MPTSTILKYASIHAILMAAYVALVATFMTFGERIFGGGDDTFFVPLAMLLLFVFSAAVSGALILGRPILWYLDGKKREAVQLFGYTLGCIFVILAAVIIVQYLVR